MHSPLNAGPKTTPPVPATARQIVGCHFVSKHKISARWRQLEPGGCNEYLTQKDDGWFRTAVGCKVNREAVDGRPAIPPLPSDEQQHSSACSWQKARVHPTWLIPLTIFVRQIKEACRHVWNSISARLVRNNLKEKPTVSLLLRTTSQQAPIWPTTTKR